MSMTERDFKDRDEQAVWELIGRHKGIEPSFGFVERTLRRLNEAPAKPSVFWRPVFRWAMAGTMLAAIAVAGLFLRAHRDPPQATVYAEVQQADYLEDFDVIASLDQLNGEGKL